jgi:hypothetical protein
VITTALRPGVLLDRRCQEIFAEELARLAHRSPSLGDDHLRTVEAALQRIVDGLLLNRARATERTDELIALFDLENPK